MKNIKSLQKAHVIYKQKAVKIDTYRSLTKSNTDSIHNSLIQQKENIKARKDLKEDMEISGGCTMCRSPLNGEMIIIGTHSSSINENLEALKFHQNQQYQWLLTEVYENFEDYLDLLYAHIGYIDNNFWPLNDFGAISFDEIENKDIEWFISRVKEKKGRPQSIIKQIRKKIPAMLHYENNELLTRSEERRVGKECSEP